MTARWREAAVLAAVVCAVYANSLGGSFHYDDFHSLVHNPHIRGGDRLADFFIDPALFSVDPEKSMYRPLLLVSYAANYAVGEYAVGGYHYVNLAVHLSCVLLVWALAGGGAGGIGAGLVFALHPICTEPVNYISSRSESLAAAWVLAALLCHIKGGRWGAVLGPCCMAAGLLVKSIAIVLVGLLPLYEVCRGERRFKQLWPYGAVALAYMALIVGNRFLGDSLAKAPRGVVEQLMTQSKALVFYAKALLLPVGLSVEPQFAASDGISAAVLASLLFIGSAAYAVFKLRWSWFYCGWFALALSPTLIVPLNVLVNEHRLYLPLAGLAIGAGAWWRAGGRGRLWLPGVVCLGLWAALVVQRNADWDDELSLWTAAADTSPQMPRVHVHLGNALRDGGRVAEARRAYERALALAPDSRPARTNLANLYYEAARTDTLQGATYLQEAVRHYEAVLQLDPDYGEALTGLGSALLQLGNFNGAERIWRRASERHPHLPDAHFNLGLLQVRMGQPAAAVAHYERALALGEDAEIYFELGNVLAGTGRLADAAVAYRSGLGLQPGDSASRYNLAEVLLVMGEGDLAQGRDRAALAKWREAHQALVQVLRQAPGHQRAQRRLAQLEERLP